MSKERLSYHQTLKNDLAKLIDALELPDIYRESMKARWLDQTVWTDKKAAQCQKRYYGLRLTTVIGGVIIPALVAFNNVGVERSQDTYLRSAFPVALFSFTQVVAICTAVEEFFQYGVRWRQYRTTAEGLKSEGWQFFQLSGAYRKAGTHLQAYPIFSTRVERIIRRDVQTYLSEVAKEQHREEDEGNGDKMAMPNPNPLTPLSSGFFAGISGPATAIEPEDPDEDPPLDPNLEASRRPRPPAPPPNPNAYPDRR